MPNYHQPRRINRYVANAGRGSDWPLINQNTALFNAGWRKMLGQPAGLMPPALSMGR